MIVFDEHDPNKAASNQKEHHGLTFAEGETVFDDSQNLTVSDWESDPGEERLVMIGMSARARVLVVVYTYRGERVRLISVREAEPSERKDYSNQ